MPSIEESIEQAMRDGQFDNLSGKGKPLRLDEHPYEDPEWRLAHHLLKESGFTLPWIQLRQEIEAEIAEAHAALRRAWEWRQSAAGETEWRQAQQAYTARIEQINRRIRDYNMQTPSLNFQMPALNAAREIDRLQAI
jgi:DnaJ family protein C protein 28